MKRRRITGIVLMLIIASLLAVGCSLDTPKPSKPNTEENRDQAETSPENNPGNPEKEETEITVPDWAKNRSYRNHEGILDFNESGIPSLPVSGDISISEATGNKMVIKAGDESLEIIRNENSSITLKGTTLYPDIDGPEWLKGKAYQGIVIVEFNERGILEYIDTPHKLSHISKITEESVDIVLVDEDGNPVEITIVKHDPTMETIKLIVGDQEEILAKADKMQD